MYALIFKVGWKTLMNSSYFFDFHWIPDVYRFRLYCQQFLLKNCEKKIDRDEDCLFFSEPLFYVCSHGFSLSKNSNVDKSVKNLIGVT